MPEGPGWWSVDFDTKIQCFACFFFLGGASSTTNSVPTLRGLPDLRYKPEYTPNLHLATMAYFRPSISHGAI